MRAEQSAGLYVALPGEQRLQIAAHVAHAGDAMREQQRKQHVFAPLRISQNSRYVDVHVPQTGNKKFSPRVNDLVCFFGFALACGTDGMNAAIYDDNRLIRLRRRARSVNDRNVLQYEPSRRASFGKQREKKKQEDQLRCQLQASRPIRATE